MSGIIPGIEEITTDPQYHNLFAAIGIIVASVSFFYPTYFRRKSAMARGLAETIRILEGKESRTARTKLLLKYSQNSEIPKEDLEKSAERVRNDLLLIQNMFYEKALSHKTFQSLYAVKIVSIVKAYEHFMKEFYPSLPIEQPIRKLYKNSYRWYMTHTKQKISGKMSGNVEDLWDKLGL